MEGPRKVFIAGATGVIGRSTVRALVAAGHDVIGLSRSAANDDLLRSLGATPARGDLFDADSLAAAAKGADVVVRAATHISKKAKPTEEDWALNNRIRRDGTRALLDAAARVGARRFVQESVCWLARPDDGAPYDEASPVNPDRNTASAVEAENLAAASAIPSATLRFGWLYGSDTAHSRAFAAMLKNRRLPVLGDGSAPLSFLHAEDAGTAMAAAITSDITGVYHVTDGHPTPVATFLDAFARALGAPRPMRVPVWIGRLAAGKDVARFMTVPSVTTADAFRKATGWEPRHPRVAEGVREIAEPSRS